MKLIVFIVFILLMGGFFIISNQELKLDNPQNVDFFFKEYYAWIDKIVKNTASTTGGVVKMEWLPDH